MNNDYLYAIGVNTGNSLDAADAVLTRFGVDGSIEDIDSASTPLPTELTEGLRSFRTSIMDSKGDMPASMKHFNSVRLTALHWKDASELIDEFTSFVSKTVRSLQNKLQPTADFDGVIDLIGFHGQTCAHQPPSIAGNEGQTYTIQIGNGQLLADQTRCTVVYDFRSDDLMNGGEAAPLAPIHHEHLASSLRQKGKFPIAFCNAGNTGNISVITERRDKSVLVTGWDVGPFNDYPDKLMQSEKGLPCDLDAAIGKTGNVNAELLRKLFEHSSITEKGENYLLQPPPKSSDPQWYRVIPELAGTAEDAPPFSDRVRTAEYFAAYVFFYSLKWIPEELPLPCAFALCGGGWNNPISRMHFEALLRADFSSAPVLDEHLDLFKSIATRIKANPTALEIGMADEFGFSGQFMEARLFGDAAINRIMGVPFSRPETTGCKTPTVLGVIRFPDRNIDEASPRLRNWISRFNSLEVGFDSGKLSFDPRWSRAAAGWQTAFATEK